MKKLWIGSVVIGGLVAGAGFAYAKIIPGVDRPFNPGAYYSSTAISYADSPSTFFYRDLAGGGNIVHDPDRKDRNVLSEAQFKEIFDALKELLKYKNMDLLPFANSLKDLIAGAQDATQKLGHSKTVADTIDKAFGNPQSTDAELADMTPKKQIDYLNEVYKAATDSASKSLQNAQVRQKLILETVERSASPEGAMQVQQAKNELSSLVHEELMERNMLLGNMTSLIAAKQQADLDREIRENRAKFDGIQQMQFSDPYHLDAYESRVFEKPKPIGFLDF